MGGKNALEYILKSIKDYCDFKNINCKFYDFNGEEIDIFKLSIKNISIMNLQKNLKSCFNILITDGYFERPIKLNVYALAFSAAANKRVLKLISKEVFDEADIIKVIEYYISTIEDNDEW